jgi:hypothetical protein
MSRLVIGKYYKVGTGEYSFYFVYNGTGKYYLDYIRLTVLNANDYSSYSLRKINDAGVIETLPQIGFGNRPYTCMIKRKVFNRYHSDHILVSDKERTKLMLKGLI